MVAVTDFMRAVPDQVARWVPRPFTSLGTDGFGRSDTRERCAGTSRWTRPTSWSAVLAGLAETGTVPDQVAAKAITGTGSTAPLPIPGRADQDPVPDSRIDQSNETECASSLALAGDETADTLLASDPLALLIGMVLDQQIPLERAFRSPADLKERLGGTLDAGAMAAMDPEELAGLFSSPPALHRFPGSMARRVQEVCQLIVDDFGGDAAAVWTTAKDGAELLANVKALPGFGEQKARIFVALLGKQLGVRPPGWEEAVGALRRAGVVPLRGRHRLPRSAGQGPPVQAADEGGSEGQGFGQDVGQGIRKARHQGDGKGAGQGRSQEDGRQAGCSGARGGGGREEGWEEHSEGIGHEEGRNAGHGRGHEEGRGAGCGRDDLPGNGHGLSRAHRNRAFLPPWP